MRLGRKGAAMKSLLASLKKVNFYPEGYEDYLCGLSRCKCLESDIQFRKTTFTHYNMGQYWANPASCKETRKE